MDVRPLEMARIALGLTMLELWVAYFALGGRLSADELVDYLSGPEATTVSTGSETTSQRSDHDMIVHALNEEHQAQGSPDRVDYSDP